MSEDMYIKIFTGSMVDVLSIKSKLEKHNIVPIIKDDSESARLSGFGVVSNMQEIFIRESEYKKIKDEL